MLLWASAGCPLAVYNTVNGFNVALVVQPQLLTVLSLVTWCQCQIYGDGVDVRAPVTISFSILDPTILSTPVLFPLTPHHPSILTIHITHYATNTLASSQSSSSASSLPTAPNPTISTSSRVLHLLRRLIPLLLLLGALETALILLCRLALRHGHLWPTTLCGVLSGVLLCAGVGCEYYGIWKSRSVEGISFLFCGIDAAGDVCSGISVCMCYFVPLSDCVVDERGRRGGRGVGCVFWNGSLLIEMEQ